MKSIRGLLILASLVLALGLAAAGCKEAGLAGGIKTPSPEVRGQVEKQRYFNAHYGLFWFKPARFAPLPAAAGQDFLFGWQDKNGLTQARLWVIPAGDAADLRSLAADLAKAKGWRLSDIKEISWQGRRALDARYQAGERSGRLRLVQGSGLAAAAAADVPSELAAPRNGRLADVLEGIRLIPPGDVLHTVKRGNETLHQVALWYTGKARNWPAIQKYNHLASAPLRVNQEILIPKELVWRVDPMPPWVFRLTTRRHRAAKARKGAAATEDAPDVELLPTGPK